MKRHGVVGVLAVVAMLSFGCAKTPVTTMGSTPSPAGSPLSSAAAEPAAHSGGTAPTSQRGSATSPAARPIPSEFVAVRDLEDIHFDFDKYAIRPDDARILDRNASWLKTNANNLLLIEDHCDERGTNEYNLALGERRAKATMDYLVSQGVADRRITVISYGEERPQCTEHNEACWAKNRRAHFLVKRG